MTDYPMMLYRDGAGAPWDGRPTDRHIVHSSDEHLAANDEGWRTAAEYWAKPIPDAAEQPKRRGRPPKATQ